MPKLNVCVVGLAKDLTDNVCIELANEMGLYYANVEKILEFELFDQENIEKLCGKDYLLKEEKLIIQRLCTYEETLINLNYFNLNNDDILNTIKKHCLLIYLHMSEDRFNLEIEKKSENNVINRTLFLDRDKICRDLADIVVDVANLECQDIAKNTVDSIIKYYT